MTKIQQVYYLRLAITSGLTAIVAYAVNTSFFGWMWMAITVYIITNVNAGATISAGISRAIGTAAGAVLGVILSLIFPAHNLLSSLIVFACIGGISAVAYARNKDLRLMAMTAAVVYILGLQPESQASVTYVWQLGLERTVNVVAGVVLSILVDVIVTPGFSTKELHSNYQKLLNLFAEAMKYLLQEAQTTWQEQHNLLEQLRKTDNPSLLEEIYFEDKLLNNNHEALLNLHQYLLSISFNIKVLLEERYHYQQQLWQALWPEYSKVLKILYEVFNAGSQLTLKQLQQGALLTPHLTSAINDFYQRLTELRQSHYLKQCTPEEIRAVYFSFSGLQRIHQELQYDIEA